MIVEINTDSEVWRQTKQALKASGYKIYLQDQLFDPNTKGLFLEAAAQPEGRLVHGMLVFDGGCNIAPSVETADENTPYQFENKAAAKSSTNVASATSVCQQCGCAVGPGTVHRSDCKCPRH